MRETCEMKRAREYGIDVESHSVSATGYSPLAGWEKARRKPEPQARDYQDPIVYALAHDDWERAMGLR